VIAAEPVPDTLATRAAVLFSAYRAGDEHRMGELIALLTPILWHTVRAQRLERTSAEDVLQTTWMALVRSADSIADPRAVLQWLLVSTRREAWRVSRRESRVEPQDFFDDEFVTPPEQLPDEVVLRDGQQRRLWDHVQRLPEKCRQLLRVVAFADRPDYATIARALGMPVGSIGPTRGRCLAKLRDLLSEDPAWEA
jgi:RNA polymerase sigma factor (sigma-70 family)